MEMRISRSGENRCPCVAECPRRTATCKVDGSCDDFIAYERRRIAGYAEKDKAREKRYASNPYLGAAHQRIIKENNRYQRRRVRGDKV